MMSFHGRFFFQLSMIWRNLRTFAFEHRTIFEVFFIFLYTIEQAVLVWLTYVITDPFQLVFVISMFALIVLSTFAFHKLVMESRIRLLENELNALSIDKSLLQVKAQFMEARYRELASYTRFLISSSKALNNYKLLQKKRSI